MREMKTERTISLKDGHVTGNPGAAHRWQLTDPLSKVWNSRTVVDCELALHRMSWSSYVLVKLSLGDAVCPRQFKTSSQFDC